MLQWHLNRVVILPKSQNGIVCSFPALLYIQLSYHSSLSTGSKGVKGFCEAPALGWGKWTVRSQNISNPLSCSLAGEHCCCIPAENQVKAFIWHRWERGLKWACSSENGMYGHPNVSKCYMCPHPEWPYDVWKGTDDQWSELSQGHAGNLTWISGHRITASPVSPSENKREKQLESWTQVHKELGTLQHAGESEGQWYGRGSC